MRDVAPTRKSSPPTRWLDTLPYFVFAVVGVIGLACVVLVFGRVNGEEFSPEAFQRRRYRFYQIPLLRMQISPVVREEASSSLEDRIATDIAAVNANDPTATWDIVTSHRAGRSIYHGDAKILCDYLDIQDDKRDFVWEKWTDDHQDLAAVLWPVVADVARSNMYVLIPELLEAARQADSPAELADDLHGYVESESLEIARALQRSKPTETHQDPP